MGVDFFDKKYRLSKAFLSSCKSAIKNAEDASESERPDAITKLLFHFEKGALAIRRELQNRGIEDEDFKPLSIKDMPVTISEKEDAFIIKTPVTIKRKNKDYSKGNDDIYFLSQYVHAAFKKWLLDNNHDDTYLYKKFDQAKFDMIFIIKRSAASFNQNLHCDNDNMENSTILNEVCSSLALGDSCLYMDLYSCFRLTDSKEDIGTEFIITGRENLAKYTKK